MEGRRKLLEESEPYTWLAKQAAHGAVTPVGSADDEDVVDGHSDVTGVMLDGDDTEWRKELAAYETGCEHRILAHLHLLRACADAAAMSRCRNLPL